ncbi:hypothetical protein BS47DRAFT_1379706 [Hydnum rufescens UP504]|uniref:Uncharacterized protein n=1 Tax=Hydnum rufescens UP504 TaxID=1448309 RepID=A0A9P6B753_9AGAM|nr:hypothetical protein BS47DRAFT_1379706 [Hydnum rufescens UP504]
MCLQGRACLKRGIIHPHKTMWEKFTSLEGRKGSEFSEVCLVMHVGAARVKRNFSIFTNELWGYKQHWMLETESEEQDWNKRQTNFGIKNLVCVAEVQTSEQEDSLLSANPDLHRLFPHLAGLPKGCAPRRNGPKATLHPNRPHVEAHERIFYWVSEQSLARRKALAAQYSGDALTDYDIALHSLWSHGTLGGYGSALADWISWCDLMKIPETSRLPISKIDLRVYLAKKVGQEGASKAKTTMRGLAAWHVVQDVPWHGDDKLAVDFRKAIASKALPLKPVPPPSHNYQPPQSPFLLRISGASTASENSLSLRSQTKSQTTVLHIPWNQNTRSIGADLLLSSWDDLSDSCPNQALRWHLKFSFRTAESAKLFAYSTPSSPSGWTAMTKTAFMNRCKYVYLTNGLKFKADGQSDALVQPPAALGGDSPGARETLTPWLWRPSAANGLHSHAP